MSETAVRSTRLRRLLRSKPLRTGAALPLLYALLGLLAAPWLLRQQFPKLVEQQLGARGSVGDLRINPFLLTLEATDLAIAEKNKSDPALEVGRLFVDFEAGSLLRWAWTFREVRI